MALVNVFSQKSFASSIPVFARVVDVQSLEKTLQIAQKADQPYVDTRTGKLRLNPFLDIKIAIKLEANGLTIFMEVQNNSFGWSQIVPWFLFPNP
jgi:hypothetical protein